MQPVSAQFLAALRGSHTPWVRVDAWYDGELVEPDLPIQAGATVNLDAGRTVVGQITGLQVADPDGRLEPRSETAALAPYGSRLHVTAGIAGLGDVVSLGWYRITRSATRTRWGWYDLADGSRAWVKRGGTVDLEADDLMWQIDAEDFLAPESPKAGATCLGEIKRLITGIVPFGSAAGVTDRGVPSSVVYNDNRSDAILALAAAVEAVPVMSPNGFLDLVPTTAGPSVWTIDVAPDDYTPGTLVDASTVLSAEDLPNAARSTGTDPATNLPLVGLFTDNHGPLRFGGPHGRIPTFHASPLITTPAEAQADAKTTLTTAQRRRAQVLDVLCLPNPALQLHDTVTLRTPVGDLDGQVRTMAYSLSPGAMKLKVAVPREAFLALWNPRQT